jgi:hypothetical protein
MNRNPTRNMDASFLTQNLQARTRFADAQARKTFQDTTGIPIRGANGLTASEIVEIAEGNVETSTTTRDAIIANTQATATTANQR